MSDSSTGTISNTISVNVGGNFVFGSSLVSGTSSFSGPINLASGANLTLTAAAGGQCLYSGVISGSGVLTTTGTGTVTLTGANTYTGVSTLSGGIVNLGGPEIAGTAGPLGQSAASNPGSIVFSGGTLQYSTSNQNDYSGRYSTAAGQSYNVDTNGQTVTWASALTSSGGSLNKFGLGTLVLTASNTYTGPTTVSGGILQIISDTQLGTVPSNPTTNITLNGGELNNNGNTGIYLVALAPNRNVYLGAGGGYVDAGWGPYPPTGWIPSGGTGGIIVNGRVSGPGGLGLAWDSGTLILNGSNNYSGVTTIGTYASYYWNDPEANPTLQLGNNHALPGTDLIFGSSANNNTATLDMNGHNATVGALSGGANAIVDIVSSGGTSTLTVGNNNASSTFGGVIQNSTGMLGMTKTGSGTLTLTGIDTYIGATAITGGTLQVGGVGVLGGGNYAAAIANGARSSSTPAATKRSPG